MKEDSYEVDYDEVDIDPSRFEGWGAHGIADPAKGPTGSGETGSLLPAPEKGSPEAMSQEIWKVEGPGFIVGCDGEMFGECFQRSLLECQSSTRIKHASYIKVPRCCCTGWTRSSCLAF